MVVSILENTHQWEKIYMYTQMTLSEIQKFMLRFHDLILSLTQTLFLKYSADVIVRLSGGRNKFEGRLEVLQNGEWGTVCYHPFQTKNKKISDVICRSLRLPW